MSLGTHGPRSAGATGGSAGQLDTHLPGQATPGNRQPQKSGAVQALGVSLTLAKGGATL